MKTRRDIIFTLSAVALASPAALLAQPSDKVWRIGYLDLGSQASTLGSGRYAALIEGLRERGYVEGKNFVLEARYADGNADRLNDFAAELVRQKADLILALGTVASHAALRATATIPIVSIASADPVSEGFAASFARPGGNMTGMTGGTEETVQKLVELLIVAVPKLKRIAVLTNPANSSHPPLLRLVQAAARQTGKQAMPIGVRTAGDIERGFSTTARERVDAVIIFADAFLLQQRTQLAGLAVKHRLPSIYPGAAYAETGGLMSYGQDTTDHFRRAAKFIDKIFKGAKPGEIPFEQPTRYYLVINRKTANALGVKLNAELLARADKVIE